ncbi:hypothetical protein KP509_21G053000 [Ceratopteris richardii]|nr:hypothetical protein KP509_21G053000 [Ceratopteris richardii]
MTVSTFRHTKDGGGKYVFDKEVRFVLHETGANNKMNGQPLRPKFNNSLVSGAGHIKGGHQSRMLISSPEGDSENVTPYNLQQSKNECNQPDYVKGESGHKEIRTKSLSSEGSQQTELAAIIITTSSKEKVKPRKPGNQVVAKDAAGWGMKFLENRTQSGWGLRLLERLSSNTRGAGDIDADKATTELHDSSTALDGSCLKGLPKGTTSVGENAGPNVSPKTLRKARRCRNRIQVDLTVILPAGIHGLPDVDGADVLQDKSTSSNGPTPLLDRWASGGNCECGGWDLGCGLSVFNADAFSLSRKSMNVALTRDDCMNWLSPRCPFKLFTQV